MTWFDRFASWTSTQISHAWFFAFCVLLVVVWAPTLFLLDVNTSQLVINTLTTIVTFLMVALLQNAQERFERSVHVKLDVLLEAAGRSDASGVESEIGA